MNLAKVGHGCTFKPGFREEVMEQMVVVADANSTMYQDFVARRPMEVETYLGSPIKLAQEAGVQVPRVETLYALLHNVNIVNQQRPQQPAPGSPVAQQAPASRMSSTPGPKGAMYGPGPNGPMNGPGPMNGGPRNGMRQGSRAPSAAGGPPPPGHRGPSMNGYPPPRGMNGNGYGPRGPPPQQMPRRPSFEGAGDLEEFSHVMLYDNMPDGGPNGMDGEGAYDGAMTPNASSGNLALRERELALRQKEIALREREFNMGRRRGPSGPPPPIARGGYDDDDEDGEDYFDPMAGAPIMPQAEIENLDMMSVTSRRTRKAPSAGQLRANPELMSGGGARQSRGGLGWGKRPPMKQHRASNTLMSQMPGLHEELMNNPLMGYSSDRYGNVDRMNMGHESRTNSLTAERLNELQHNGPPGGPFPPMSRRGSQSPGNPLSPGQRPPQHMQRISPPNGYGPHQQRISPPNGYAHHPQGNGPQYGPNGPNGRPSPPGLRQPMPQRNNAAVPQQIEQTTSGVSTLKPHSNNSQVRSLTGSASASAGSGESNRSGVLAGDSSEISGNSSSSSLGPRAPGIGVR